MPTILQDTFKAWIDRMPGGGPTLIVIGQIEVPTSGWHVGLARRSPQGINPNILILDVTAQPPHGMASQVITRIPVRYEERPPEREYKQVTIANGEEDRVTIDVGETQ